MSAGGLDLDVDPGRQTQLVERLDRLGGRLHDVDQPLVRADLELLAGLLVDVRARLDRVALDARRQRDRSVNHRAGPLRRIHDLRRALIEHGVIVRLHPNPNDFTCLTRHGSSPGISTTDLPINSDSPPTGRETSNRIMAALQRQWPITEIRR